MADTFQEIFESLLNVHAPIKKRVSSEFAPWLTSDLMKIIEDRKIAAKSPEMWSAYTRQRTRVTREVSHSIRDYYEGLIEKNKGDPKKVWKQSTRSWIEISNPQQSLVSK